MTSTVILPLICAALGGPFNAPPSETQLLEKPVVYQSALSPPRTNATASSAVFTPAAGPLVRYPPRLPQLPEKGILALIVEVTHNALSPPRIYTFILLVGLCSCGLVRATARSLVP